MGFDAAKAQCLVVIAYCAVAVVMFIQVYYGGMWHLQGTIVVFNAVMGMYTLSISNNLPSYQTENLY